MKTREFHGWMWGEALALLEQAERMQRQFFQAAASPSGQIWEPPVDIVDDALEVRVEVALPGVRAEAVRVVIEPGCVVISALRPFPRHLPDTRIHRLEIPYGRFERRVPLPARVEFAGRSLAQGMLTLIFRKSSQNTEAA